VSPPRRKGHVLPLQRASLQSLAGARLLLRQPRIEDRQDICHYASNPLASRFMGWSTHRDEGESQAFLEGCIADWEGDEHFAWAMECAGRVVGMIAVQLRGRNAGIGYVVAPDAWGEGYASEALALVSEELFCHSPISAIWALCVTDNPASARVLEKCGYQRDALLPAYFLCPNLDGERHDVWRYVRYRHPTQHGAKPV
jgi:ribosomal-protein-alanine N-acetyltransferase